MSKLSLNSQYRIALQFCAAGTLAALMSGCSSDTSRFDPFGNPFSTASNDTAPAPTKHRVASADVIPAGRMPPVTSQALAPRAAGYANAAPVRNSSVAFREPVSRETTGSIEPAPVRSASAASARGWTTTGGTPIQVAEGESADVLAARYGVPSATLLQVNGLRSSSDVRPGARIIIPVYGAAATPSRVAAAPQAPERAEPEPAAKPQTQPAPARVAAVAPAPEHVARARMIPAPARTALASPPHNLAAPVATRVAAAETRTAPAAAAHLKPVPQPVKMAEKTRMVAQAPEPKAAPVKAIPVQQVATAKIAAVKTAQAKPVAAAPVKAAPVETPKVAEAAPAPVAAAPAAAAAPVQTASAADNPEFRWPARGRIIQGFKGGSAGNDGINIALPEGTAIKAAEGGVVAYAGSELKGYGNLVLIRHPNGFVSAYANNGEIDVKRGESVKRGQQIAKSGQSGNVSSPQLHFELRKGSTPVDPTQYLAGL